MSSVEPSSLNKFGQVFRVKHEFIVRSLIFCAFRVCSQGSIVRSPIRSRDACQQGSSSARPFGSKATQEVPTLRSHSVRHQEAVSGAPFGAATLANKGIPALDRSEPPSRVRSPIWSHDASQQGSSSARSFGASVTREGFRR
jgi:hypothetical protein